MTRTSLSTLLGLTLTATLTLALPQATYEPGQTSCGGGLPACPSGQACVATSARCTDMSICAGVCEPIPGAVKYPACSVSQAEDNHGCPATTICIADPRGGGCGAACDAPGICIGEEPQVCGGIAGIQCSDAGMGCYEDPRDGCDPLTGGRDCSGICV